MNARTHTVVDCVVAVAAAAGFAVLAVAVSGGTTNGFDASVRGAVHSWASPGLTQFMRIATDLGEFPVLLALAVVAMAWLVRIRRRHHAVVLAVAALGGEAFCQILKLIFQRPRPAVFFGLPQPSTYSFPSGHSLESFCFYGVLAAVLASDMPTLVGEWAVWCAAAAITMVVGLSRVYLGVHYPTDVLGGYAAATVWVATLHASYRGIRARRKA